MFTHYDVENLLFEFQYSKMNTNIHNKNINVRGSNSDSLGSIIPTSSVPQSAYVHIRDGDKDDLLAHLAGNNR